MENLNEYTLEELNEFLESDEYQQLDELSKKTLGSYIKKASKDAVNNASEGGYKLGGNADKVYDDDDDGESNDRKAATRTKGIAKATDKLVKEEELNELSKKTLGSYVKKATQDVSDNDFTAGTYHDKQGDLNANRSYDHATKAANKRKAGISKAVDKLVKESQDLDSLFYQIEKGDLSDAKQTVTEILSNKVSDTLSTMKQQLSKNFVTESSCNVKNGDVEVDAAVENLPKPKKAKQEVDGDGNVIEKWKPVKESEELDETVVQSKNKKVNDKIDDMFDKAKANTKYVNVKDLFKKK